MKRIYLFTVLLTLSFTTSCSTLMNLMPEVSMEKRQVIYDMADAMAFPKVRDLTRSKERRMSLKAGQWITTLSEMKEGDKNVTLTTTKVISVKGDTVVLEQETRSAVDDGVLTSSQVTIKGYPIKGPLSYSKESFDAAMADLQVTRIITKASDGTIVETPPQILAMTRGMGQQFLSGASVRLTDAERVEFTGTYIASKSCFEHHYALFVLGVSTQGRCLSHSSIPVSGIIKDENNQATVTTVAYGYNGARSVF